MADNPQVANTREDNPQLEAMVEATIKHIKEQEVMKSWSGSSCVLKNKCKCGHFARYHTSGFVRKFNGFLAGIEQYVDSPVAETGNCTFCNCKEFRHRTK